MDISALQKKAVSFLKKYRYALLVLAIGLVLMAIPGKSKEVDAQTDPSPPETAATLSVSEQLAQVLSQIDGAGRVEVLLTEASGEETIYQTDENTSITDGSSSVQKDTVTVTDAQRNQLGLIRQINPPTYLGAVVVCQGADSPTVKLAIVEAVSRVTGLGTDRISVLKMK